MAFCKCCEGSGQVPAGYYLITLYNEMWICTGEVSCPGCDGSGISVRAHQWRKENNYNG